MGLSELYPFTSVIVKSTISDSEMALDESLDEFPPNENRIRMLPMISMIAINIKNIFPFEKISKKELFLEKLCLDISL